MGISPRRLKVRLMAKNAKILNNNGADSAPNGLKTPAGKMVDGCDGQRLCLARQESPVHR